MLGVALIDRAILAFAHTKVSRSSPRAAGSRVVATREGCRSACARRGVVLCDRRLRPQQEAREAVRAGA
jgi:hypothetical protein